MRRFGSLCSFLLNFEWANSEKRRAKNRIDDGARYIEASAFNKIIVNVRVVISAAVLPSYTFLMCVSECIENMLHILLRQYRSKRGTSKYWVRYLWSVYVLNMFPHVLTQVVTRCVTCVRLNSYE